MKSKINHLGRTEQQANLEFKMDKQIIKNIEKTFQELKPNFKLSNYKKEYGEKILDNFWELDKKTEGFKFTLVVGKDIVRFKLKGSLNFINKFLKILMKYAKFSELSPKIKAKLERKRVKGQWWRI